MLFPSPETQRQWRQVSSDMQAGKIDGNTAARKYHELGEEAMVDLIRGEERKQAGDLDGAESWFWKGLALQPGQFTFYLALAEVRRGRDPDDSLAPRLSELALWKLADTARIPDVVAEHFGKFFDDDDLDFGDPETYLTLATVKEVQREEQEEPPEVRERLLPYLLLNDLQHQAPDVVADDVLREIQANAGQCMPLLWAAVRDWARYPQLIQPKALAMFVAVLGEIGGADLVPDLMELAIAADPAIFLHANWALWRIGQRFPDETLAAFREQGREVKLTIRCAVAEQLALLPEHLDIRPAAMALLDGFRGFAKRDDAPHLLMAILYALTLRGDEKAGDLLGRYGDMLTRKGRDWMAKTIESEESFIPRLVSEDIEGLDIDDVCVRRILMDDEEDEDSDDEDENEDVEDGEDEDDGEYDDEEREGAWESPTTFHAPLKPGRNDTCWCGSGKKYKKCHLSADEQAERSGKPAPPQAPRDGSSESPNQIHKRLGNRVLSATRGWYDKSELQRAYAQYFGPGSDPSKLGDEAGDLFFQWYLHDYRPESTGHTAFAEFLHREGGQLNPRDRAMLESMRDARYGLYEVQRVEEGRGVEVRNVYRGDPFFVHDVSSSRELVKWDGLLSRVEYFEERYTFTGNGQKVPRTLLKPFQDLIEAESRKARLKPAEFVEANSHLLPRKLVELHGRLMEGFTVTDSTGEPIEFSTATYEIVGDLPPVVAGLLAIQGVQEVTSKEDPAGHRHFEWVETGVEGPGRALGHIEIVSQRMKLSCTTRRNLEQGRRMLEKPLRRFLRHREDHFETVAEARQRREREGPPKDPPKRLDPEIERQIVLKYKTEHYTRWVDESLPALDGKTPREAVRTERGRRQVRDLIRGIENLEEGERKRGRPALDLTELRRTLGVTED
jgi:hypothetical protein